MKKIIGWIMSWGFWAIGDIVSRCISDDTGWLYPIYNRFMVLSSAVQDWSAVNGPWETPEDTDTSL